MEEIKLNMENLSKEEREQLLKLVEKANKKRSKVWKPEDGDIYYFIDNYGDIYHTTCGYYATSTASFCPDDGMYAIGNCFKTKEEAEFALERHKVIVELERFAKENNDPSEIPTWEIGFNRAYKKVTGVEYIDHFVSNIRFTCAVVDKAIEAVGEDRLKKYYFGVKD